MALGAEGPGKTYVYKVGLQPLRFVDLAPAMSKMPTVSWDFNITT